MTPTTCKALIDAGYDVTVERSTQRIFEGMFQPKKTPLPALLTFGLNGLITLYR